MPTTIRCPHDDGDCTIPDQAIVISDGRPSILTSDLVDDIGERGADLAVHSLREAPEGTDYRQLVAEVAGVVTVVLSSGATFAPASILEFAGPTLTKLLKAAKSRKTVIVQCSCDHTWVQDRE